MTESFPGKEAEPKVVYADIIHLPHPVSRKHPPMSLHDRAAQFTAYKALSGYEDMVSEQARRTESRIELTEEEQDRLSQKLDIIRDLVRDGVRPLADITYFLPDPLKDGGRYETVTERIRRVDAARGKLILMKTEGYGKSSVELDIWNILDIRGEAFGNEE